MITETIPNEIVRELLEKGVLDQDIKTALIALKNDEQKPYFIPEIILRKMMRSRWKRIPL